MVTPTELFSIYEVRAYWDNNDFIFVSEKSFNYYVNSILNVFDLDVRILFDDALLLVTFEQQGEIIARTTTRYTNGK